MLVRSLVSRGFACCEAEDGLEALSEMSRSSNHLIRKLPQQRSSNASAKDVLMAGGGGASTPPRTPVLSPRSAAGGGSRMKLSGAACTNLLERLGGNIQHYSIDAVLIDYHMPKMNGPECIVELRMMGFRGPIIGVSGGDEKTTKQFFEAGADNVIQKPAKTDTLVGILLTGLEMVVVFDETQQRKPTTASSAMIKDMDKDGKRDTDLVRQEHMGNLLTFLVETKAKAEATAEAKALAILTPVLAAVIAPVLAPVFAPFP